MTVESTNSKVSMLGNGTTTTLSITYPYLDKSNIKVYQKDDTGVQVILVYGQDYTIVDIKDVNNRIIGGTITFTTAPAVGVRIVALREVEYTQETDYRENDIFPAETHELALDKLTMETQELKELVDRAIKTDVISDIDPDELVQQMERVYESIDNIDINADHINDINTNAENIVDINNVASIKEAVVNTSSISNEVVNVSDNMQEVIDLNDNKTNIDIVAGINEDITKVANINDKVSAVADNETNINTLADNIGDVIIDATAIEEIKKTADISMEISNVNDIADEIVAVDGNKTNINIVAENIADIKDKMNVDFSNTTHPEKLVPPPTVDNTALTFKNGVIDWGKASAENDGITIHENAQDKLEVLGMIDAVDSTQVRKTAYVTQEWYDEHYANHTLVEGVEYITPSQVSSNVKSFRNVSDIFLTMRLDEYLNGAVPCDGAEYDTRDYTGPNSIGVLLANNKVPYCTYAEYQAEITAHGVCGFIAWDGGYKFKVPTLQDVYIEASNTNVAEFGPESLPNIEGKLFPVLSNDGADWTNKTGAFSSSQTSIYKSSNNGSANYFRDVDFKASNSSSTYQDNAKVKTDRIKYRAMIQLATQTTDEAIATMTHLQSLPHIIQSAETANGGYNVYSNGYYEEWGFQPGTGAYGLVQVNLSKTMKNTNYSISSVIKNLIGDWFTNPSTVSAAAMTDVAGTTTSKTVNSFKIQSFSDHTWKVSGFLEEGQY